MNYSLCDTQYIIHVTLWLFNIAMGNGPFIDGLPINSMVIFHGYVSHNQMAEMFSHGCSSHPPMLGAGIFTHIYHPKKNG